MKKSLILVGLMTCSLIVGSAYAGFLGKRYISLGIGSVRPGDDEIRDFDSSILTYGANCRFPVDSHLDIIAGISRAEISGEMYSYNPYTSLSAYPIVTPVSIDGTSTTFRGGLTYQFKPGEKINPYVGIGFAWNKTELESMGESIDEDDTGAVLGGGLEANVNEQLSFGLGISYHTEMYDEDETSLGVGLDFWATPQLLLSFGAEYALSSKDAGVSGGVGFGF